jgi:hypothetical protein
MGPGLGAGDLSIALLTPLTALDPLLDNFVSPHVRERSRGIPRQSEPLSYGLPHLLLSWLWKWS